MNSPSVTTELARNVPLSAGALYLSFISQYGSVLVTTLALVYGVLQIVLRWREHQMKKKEYVYVGS